MNNKMITYIVLALIIGGFSGFFIGRANQPFSNLYMQDAASMMKDNGTTMMQMGT